MVARVRKLIERFVGGGLGGETVRYVIVGALTTLVNFGLFELMHVIIGIDVTVSNVTSISVSILFAYVANKLVVFKRRSGSAPALAFEFFKFVGSRLFTMALEVGAVALFYGVLGFDARFGKIAAQAIVIVANYAISKVIVFRGG